MKKIMIMCAAHFGLGVDELRLGGCGNGCARFVAAYLGVKEGCSLDEVAASLGMSTVSAHLAAKSIARKLGSGLYADLEQAVAAIRSRSVQQTSHASSGGNTRQTHGAPSYGGVALQPHRFHVPRQFQSRFHYGFQTGPNYGNPHSFGNGVRVPGQFGGNGTIVGGGDDSFFRNHRFVIDALNVCYLGNDHKKANHPCLANMIALTRDLDRRGAEWQAFWDPFNSNRFVQPGEANRFDLLMHNDPRHVQVVGMKADLAVLMAASKPSPSGLPSLILTNDFYRDAAASNFPIAQDQSRFLRATKVGNEIWFPSANCWCVTIG